MAGPRLVGLTKIDCDDNESDDHACETKCEDISHVMFSDPASRPNGRLGWRLRRGRLFSTQALFPDFLSTIVRTYGFVLPRIRAAGIAHRCPFLELLKRPGTVLRGEIFAVAAPSLTSRALQRLAINKTGTTK